MIASKASGKYSNPKELVIEFTNGDKLNIVYDKGKYTPRMEAEMMDAGDKNRGAEMIISFLCNMIISWDLCEWDPEDMNTPEEMRKVIPVPLDKEHLLKTDYAIDFFTKIADAISAEQRPNQT